MHRSLAFSLHALTARLDRAADRVLQAEEGVSYARFLALFMVGELGASTQKELAQHLGVTEPSVSRMTATLAAAGLLAADFDPAGGNRRRLVLTLTGAQLVRGCCERLEAEMSALVDESGVPYEEYLRHTERMLLSLGSTDQLTDGQSKRPETSGSTPTASARQPTMRS
jgi:DNA-binding MarR family transcriptional regulator